MKLVIERKFSKEVKKCKDQQILKKIKEFLRLFEDINSVADIPNTKPLVGYPGFYRTRISYRYRIGFFVENNEVYLLKFSSREGFYKEFPPE